jgi:FkbM family methyltransferase
MIVITEPGHREDLKNILDHHAVRDIPKRGVVHVGADVGQEVEQYLCYGFEKIVLIDANPRCCETLFAKFGRDSRVKIFNYAVCDRQGILDFHVHTSHSGSTEPASILPMKRFKEIVRTLRTAETIKIHATTLDALFEQNGLARRDYNFLNIDVQGAELMVLHGALSILDFIDAVVSETNLIELYDGGSLEHEIVDFLAVRGFEKKHAIYHTLYDDKSTFPAWGECLFVKKRELGVA